MTYEELGIDPAKLKRDYIKNPLKRKEMADKDDLYYLAIELLLLPEDFITLFGWNKNKVNHMLSKLGIPRANDILVEYRKKCFKRKYGVENPQQIGAVREKTASTNIKKYGGIAPQCSKEIKDKSLTTFFKNKNIADINAAKLRCTLKRKLKEERHKIPKEPKMTFKTFKEKANKIHNNKYNYPEQLFKNKYTKIKIICPKHGIFEQRPNSHLEGRGCPKCAIEKDRQRKYFTQEQFIARCKKYHPEYDYSKAIYKGGKTLVTINCPKHGEFQILANNLMAGHGCSKCHCRPSTKESFIEAAIKVHGNKYDYSNVIYKGGANKVEIICPKHGSFWSTPGNHLSGKGCFKCQSSKSEKKIRELLTEMNIGFIEQKRFKDCRDKNPLPFDFYLPKYNLCIEYQGEQHYIPVKRGNISKEQMKENLKKVQKRDQIKRKYCKEKGILLLEIKYTDNIEEKLKEVVPEED